MARRKSKTLTELELEIMQIVWSREEVAVEDIRQALDEMAKPLALPSIRTMLGILQDKGYVARRAQGRRHLYRACVPRDAARETILKDVLERAFDGSALDLVAALIDKRLVSAKDINAVRRLIQEAERRGKK